MIPTLDSLKAMTCVQQPTYDDPAEEAAAVARLREFPPLVFAGECDDLKARLADWGHRLAGCR